MDRCGCVASFTRLWFSPEFWRCLHCKAAPPDARQAEASETEESDSGFHLLYELKPGQARAQFVVWQAAQPEDPMGRASEAASYLFEEYFRQGPRGIFSRASERVGITHALKDNCFRKTRKLCPE